MQNNSFPSGGIWEQIPPEMWDEVNEALLAGDMVRFAELYKSIPISPEVALAFKEGCGSDFVKNSGLNLTAADRAYGSDWLR